MRRAIPGIILIVASSSLVFGQPPVPPPPPPPPAASPAAPGAAPPEPAGPRPKFVAADVHIVSGGIPAMRTIPAHDGRYEIKGASMLDLVRTAYGFDPDKILGGPSWLELDRFDITAKLPGETSPDDQKLMLQTLLEDRFKLVARKETKPIAGYALTAGKKPALKEAAGTEETGCKPQSSSGPAPEGGGMLMIGSSSGAAPIRIALGPNTMITYNCRNMTMDAGVRAMRTMIGANLGTTPILDETGLKGAWNFDISFSLSLTGLNLGGDSGDRVSIFEAIDKQLGLKLEPRQIPTPVLAIESVNRTPSPNTPDLAELMPPIPQPTAFDVASIKPSDPGSTSGGLRTQPGGRLTVQGYPMRLLLTLAFRDPLSTRSPQITNTPKWADTARFDITAKTPPDTAPLDSLNIGPPLLALFKERFKLAYHTEQQPGTAYNLQAAKPKMKAADPAGRTSCNTSSAPAGSPGGSMIIKCQNITMAQFADWLSTRGIGLSGPVTDTTALEGAYDFSLNFNLGNVMARSVQTGQPAEAPAAAEPMSGYTIFEAIEKQLGLKLETTKSAQPIIVIDHMEEKPTEDQ